MVMPDGQQLLRPASPAFIGLSITIVFAFSLLSSGKWIPDILLLVLTFWGIHQPLRIGMGIAFALGIGMDVQQTTLLGQHALAYVFVMFMAYSIRLRLLWFSPTTQAGMLLPIFLLAYGLQVLVYTASGNKLPESWLLLAPISEALLWPFVSKLLLAPQYAKLRR